MDQNTNPPQEGQTIEGPTVMTTGKIPKNAYWLFIDSTGGVTTFDNVMCLVNFSFAGTTATNDASTMCGPDSSPGDLSSSVTFTGQTFINPDTGEISAPDIFELWNTSKTIGWKIGPVETPTSGDMTKTGQGYLSAYGENYDNGQKGAFSGTITIAGLVTQVITP